MAESREQRAESTELSAWSIKNKRVKKNWKLPCLPAGRKIGNFKALKPKGK